MEFTGFTEETRQFFRGIALHNEKAYYDAHKKEYHRYVRDPMRALTAAVSDAVLDVDDRLETRPEHCVARIRRDTRFSKDKTPYRDHLWTGFRQVGERTSEGMGLYIEVSAADIAWGMGFYNAEPKQMAAIRQAILARRKVFTGLASDKRVFDTYALLGRDYLRLPPECADADPILLPWLTKRGFYLEHAEPFDPGAADAGLPLRIGEDFRALGPLYGFLTDALIRKA